MPGDNMIDILNEPIAIVGANCQFPGMEKDIEDIDAFHEMLLKEQTPIKEVPGNRWDINQYYDPDRQKEDKIVSHKGGFLEDPRLFDAAYFKIPPIEAKQIDPQHRLFLEVSIRALNDANITLDSLKNSNTGIYCGISSHDYSQLNFKDNIQFNAYTNIGCAGSAAAGRLAYFLNLKGPCISVDTACSSSSSALYLAAMALRTQQCNMAIVGGVHLSLCPEMAIGLSKANMLSALGESRSFDANADGFVRSEGGAVVILKRLSHAIKSHHKIHAVIKSIIMNQDGGGMGMTAPNMEAHTAIHHTVLEKAQLSAGDIDYIETHGTGTILGDAIEFQAIQNIHQEKHSQDKPLIIGALKSNIGHTMSASGLAALVKVIGALRHEVIPPNLHYLKPNCSIDPDCIPALFPLQAKPFPKNMHKKRYVQISNFGFTGTNVSAIIEEPPHIAPLVSKKDDDEAQCFVISANSERSLHLMLQRYLSYLRTSHECLSDICYTLINCRDHYSFRCAIIAKDKESLIKKIESQDYAFKKVILKEEVTLTSNNAKENYDYFLSGANIRSDHNKVQFNPIDLPLYVFDRKSYWHDVRAIKEIKLPEDWHFELQWQEHPIDKKNYRDPGRRWLLIGEQQRDFGLNEKGLTIVQEEDNYSLDELDGIIFAESFHPSLSDDIDARIEQQKSTLKKILALLKALNDKAIALRFIFLTKTSSLDSSPLKGFCKTLCLELPQYQSILIDLDNQDEALLAEQIMNEINYNHGQCYEHTVSYHEGKRLVSRLIKISPPTAKVQLCTEGRYLITGGCGGLGLVTADALLAAGAKELVLVSRSIDKPSITENVKKLQSNYPDRIIRPVSLDISDKAHLLKFLLTINEDGLLKGIIHAAGASVNKLLLQHQDQDIDYLFSAKVKGGWYLHELTKDYELDFFVVYSSISSIFGSNRESFYSATNSFLDALISERQRIGLVGTGIQWGPWAEVGMAEKRAHNQNLKDSLIYNAIGKAFIQQLVNHPLSHTAIISPAYLQFMLDFVPAPQPLFYQSLTSELSQIEPPLDTKPSTWLSDYSKLDYEHQLTTCRDMIATICKELLGMGHTEFLDTDEGFFHIGFDSLMMAELATRLKEKLKPLLHIVATIAFDYPSINKLSHYLRSELKHHLLSAQKPAESSGPQNDDIAIIGMSCSLPHAPDVASFEQLLENGLSGIQDIRAERWVNRLYYDSNPEAPRNTYVTKLGLIDNIKLFDPQFFGISPREAPFLDPQQRLFLENCYYAMENANYPTHALRGSSTGVFAGVGSSEYYTLLEKSGFASEEQEVFYVTGKALNIVAGRVAYTFDFKGPALSIDTACSSSLVAIHYACNSLKNREIDFALAGGVNVILRPEPKGVIHLSKAKALSPDGQCKTFDEHADGYVRSEGCGVLFLKRMSDALRDNDHILAVIKGSAINHDGKTAGLTAPSGKSQEDVISKALNQAKLASSDISYIEAHGTGTTLGDPIEVHAINAVYGKQRGHHNPLYIGAVKTNVGHLESAAGVASVIKVILSLQKKRIYKNLNFNRLNPKITLGDTQIALHNKNWQSNTPLRSAGVTACGFSGTNAHIILQEFPENTKQKETFPLQTNALVLSAKSPTALNHLRQCYQQFLATTTDDFNHLCYTAAMCRDHHPYRLTIIAKDALSASQLLKNGEFATSDKNNNCLELLDDPKLKLLIIDYLQGKQVDWASYYHLHQDSLSKVALPNYPFDRHEYWLDLGNKKALEIPSTVVDGQFEQNDTVSYDTASEHLYEIEWHVLHSKPQISMVIPDFWVISTDKARAKKIFGSLKYQLIDNISQLEQIKDKNIVFVYEENQFYDLFHCCQAMFKSPPKSFTLVTENAYAVSHPAFVNVNPHHSMACAFWKSFQNELELNRNYAIDLDTESSLATALAYVFNTTSGETQFAVRDDIYVPRLKKKGLLVNSIPQQRTIFDPEACYLITGGTGGLAKPLMEYLIRNGVKHIVITSRVDCPLNIKNFIESAREKEVDIIHYSADASNLLHMQDVIERIQSSDHPLKGIFHLAGVIRDELLINLVEEEVQQVLRAKMESAFILHQLTKEISLDLFVLFSSASSILGSRRQANYAAANGFLDGLAHLRQQLNLPALAINWGVFHSAGMAVEKITPLKTRGFIPLDGECIDILNLLLRSDITQIVLCPIHWDLYFKNTPRHIELSEFHETKSSRAKQSFLSFLQQHTQQEQSNILRQVLSDIAANVLGLDSNQFDNKNDLFAMGMDSLMSLELRSRIHDKLQCPNLNLPIEYFINDPKIDKISNNIAKKLHEFFAETQQQVPTENKRAGAIPLSDAQYGFWILNRRGHGTNCPKQIQFRGKLNTEYLSKAFAFTVSQNSAFWLNFHQDIPIQTVRRQGQFTLVYEDISTSYDQKILDELFYENTMEEIPLTAQPLIRAYLYKLNEELHELHIMIPHIILDETGYRVVLKQLKSNYERLVHGKSLIPTHEQYDYLDYVKQNNSHYEQNLKDKVNFWQVYNNGFQKLSLGHSNHLPDAARQPKNVFRYILDEQFVEKFKEWHQEKNINVSTGLITAFHIVFYKLSSQMKIPIITLHNGRESSHYSSLVGLCYELKRINITLNERHTFLEFCKSIENEFIKAAPFQKCSQYIKSIGFKDTPFSITHKAISLYHKISKSKKFKVSHPNSMTRSFYLKSMSRARWLMASFVIKDTLNQLLHTRLRLLKPTRMSVIFNITASFFTKEPIDNDFSGLNITWANELVDRPIGNQSLWIMFTKDQYNQYKLSINGPLTIECKDRMALEFNHVMTKMMANEEYQIADLIK